MRGSLLLRHPGHAGSGAKRVGVDPGHLLPIQRLGVRKGARVWEAENCIPGLKPSLRASAFHLGVKGGKVGPFVCLN